MHRAVTWDEGNAALRRAAVTAVALVVTLEVALVVRRAEHLSPGLVVLAVALASILSQSALTQDLRARVVSLALVPLVTVLVLPVGTRLQTDPLPADTVFALLMGSAIAVRRWGRLATSVGSFVVLPLVAMLVTPPATLGSDHRAGWAAAMALVAAVTVHAAQLGGQRIGLSPLPRREVGEPSRTRPSPSTRQGLQMTVAVGVGFVVAHQLFPTHTTFLVLTAYLVNSGNRGRGDVLHKAGLRVVGASAGTLVASALAGAYGPGQRSTVVLMMAVIIVATWLRAWSYSIWAAGVTCVVALLQGFFGEPSRAVLETRLESIALGAVIGAAAASFVLPLRSTDVARRRCADALAALQALVDAARKDPATLGAAQVAFAGRVSLVRQVARPVQLHGRLRTVLGRGPLLAGGDLQHPCAVVTAILKCDGPARVLAAMPPAAFAEPGVARLLGRTALSVGDARRCLGGKAVEPHGPWEAAATTGPLQVALARLDAAMESAVVAIPEKSSGP